MAQFGQPKLPFLGSSISFANDIVSGGNARYTPGGTEPFRQSDSKRRKLITPNSYEARDSNGRPQYPVPSSVKGVGTIGFRSNYSVPSGYVHMRAYAQGDELPGEHQLAIIKVESPDDQQVYSVEFGQLQNTTQYVGFTLPSFNHMLAINQTKQDALKMFFKGAEERLGNVNYHSLDSIISNFYVQGVGETSEFETGGMAAPRGSRTRSYTGTEARRTNFIISGRVMIKNLFGNVKVGDHLWIVIKRVRLPSAYVTNDYRPSTGNRVTRTIDPATKQTLVPNPYQAVPYATTLGFVPQEMREYREMDGSDALGHCIHLGIVFKEPQSASPTDPLVAMRNLSYVNEQNTLEMSVTY